MPQNIFPGSLRASSLSIGQAQQQSVNARLAASAGQVFSALDPLGDIVPDQQEIISQTLWSNSVSRLTSFFTSSTNSSSNGEWYYDVYNGNPSASTSTVQFSVAYGDSRGSGSLNVSANASINGQTPSKAIYSQYRNILLNPGDESFTLADNTNAQQIIAITFLRSRYKERLDPGNWEIWASGSLGSKLESIITDDSTLITNASQGRAGRIYNVVSGSISAGVSGSSSPLYLGLIYPDSGIIILDAAKLSSSLNLDVAKKDSNTSNQNHYTYIQAVSRSVSANANNGPSVRNQQTVTSTFYFVRVKNSNYNFSNNPTFVTGSVGDIRHSSMINNPTVYITTIGLYNDSGECLATANLSKPLKKDFFTESLFKIKLSY